MGVALLAVSLIAAVVVILNTKKRNKKSVGIPESSRTTLQGSGIVHCTCMFTCLNSNLLIS